MKKLIYLFLLFISFQQITSQEVLNNNSIIELIDLGFEDSVIIDKINNTETNFDTNIENLKVLKEKGLSSEIMSAMINKSKENKKPLSNGIEYYEYATFDGEVKKAPLYRTKYFKNLSELELYSLLNLPIQEAKMGLKSPTTFNLTQVTLTRNPKKINNLIISYTGQNDYGATKSSVLTRKFEYVNENYTEELQRVDAEIYYYSRVILDNKKSPIKGKVTINNESVDIIIYGGKLMGDNILPNMPTPNREYISENHWISNYEEQGIKGTTEFNKNDKKYKSDGGTLTMTIGFNKMIYILKTSK
jgi:hypothetical protein